MKAETRVYFSLMGGFGKGGDRVNGIEYQCSEKSKISFRGQVHVCILLPRNKKREVCVGKTHVICVAHQPYLPSHKVPLCSSNLLRLGSLSLPPQASGEGSSSLGGEEYTAALTVHLLIKGCCGL